MAVVTAAPSVGRLLAYLGIGRLPEETDRPDILVALHSTVKLRRDD
jgi:hypothetical protein